MSRPLRLAFVVQRYGTDVAGGAEELCRTVAERLRDRFSIKVLTSTAKDYLTWENHYPAGSSQINGVPLRRFLVTQTRRVRAFGRFSQKLYNQPHSFSDEAQWMDRQGPSVPALYDFILRNEGSYDLFVFFTYLYPPTFLGLPLVAHKSILLPMAHDEPPLHLGIFRALFHLPRGLIFNTEGERILVHKSFRNEYLPSTVAGVGIDVPHYKDQSPDEGDYLLYLGRVDVEKGCREMVDFFLRHKQKHPSGLKLLLAGEQKMKLPRHDEVVPLGYVSSENKALLLAGARALIMPSVHESLSLAALEAWAAGAPVLAHRGSDVLAAHVEESGGGWLYRSFSEFSRLLADLPDLAALKGIGLRGRRYVEKRYRWDRVLSRYERFFQEIAAKVRGKGADRD